MARREPPSFARVILTPMLLMAAGFLVAGLVGLGLAGALGIVWVVWAVTPPER